MSTKLRKIGPEPSPDDVEIELANLEMTNPRVAQGLAKCIEMGLVVDSGRRGFQNGEWQIVWVAAEYAPKKGPTSKRDKTRLARRSAKPRKRPVGYRH
jgi:hypothetical protein